MKVNPFGLNQYSYMERKYTKNLSGIIKKKLVYDFLTKIKIIIVIRKVFFFTCGSLNAHYQLNISEL